MTTTDKNSATLSVVIPSYNSASFLPSTLAALVRAVRASSWLAEIIVVDDGSTDGTATVVAEASAQLGFPVRLISQENKGRFFARWAGLTGAKYDRVLLIDSRVLIDEGSLAHVLEQDARPGPIVRAWNAHTVTDPRAPLVGHFWEVPVSVFWGSYLRAPVAMNITPENFDRVPKGTTAFLVERQLFLTAAESVRPEQNAQLTSDDTKILRLIAAQTPIRLDPGFSAIYRPRTSLRAFLSHSFDRGTLFVDSYAGTGTARTALIALLVALPPLAVVAVVVLLLLGLWGVVLILVAAGILVILVPVALAARNRASVRGVAAYLLYFLPFGFSFWRGLARGLVIHRASLTAANRTATTP